MDCYEKSFASHEKAVFWSPDNKNTPREVFKNDNRKYRFNCGICSHSFESVLSSITRGGWCPYCSNPPKSLCENLECQECFKKSFASHPKAAFWSPENKKTPREVSISNGNKYKFVCGTCTHVFESVLSSITRGRWCPYCSNPPISLCKNLNCQECFTKSFASHPKAVGWSIDNVKIPREVFKSSGNKYKFNCEVCCHNFESRIADINKGNWCPYCSNPPVLLCKNIECQKCFEKSFASHEKAVFWSADNEKTAREVFKSTQTKYRFKCGTCSHHFESLLGNITCHGQWCPYCSNPPKSLCENLECQECFEKSFASHPKAAFWSAENKNTPRMVFKKGDYIIKFNCEKCSHIFESNLNHITNGSWCSYCANKKLCTNECTQCFNKSFASHPKAAFWSPENKKTPREVFKNDNDKYRFKCGICNHSFDACLNYINRGGWCAYCANKKLCTNECIQCFNKSFASHPKAVFWSAENIKKPREVFKKGYSVVKFNCNKCSHVFKSILYNITNGTWCPHCANKTEQKLYEWLLTLYPGVQREQTFEWCKNPTTGRYYRYDFCIESLKCLIELDGAQHFTQVSNWNAPRLTQETDIFKMKKANEQSYTVIRLLQEDVFNDKIDWKQALTQKLQSIQAPTHVYICENNEYADHAALYIELHDRDIQPIDEDEDDDEGEDDADDDNTL